MKKQIYILLSLVFTLGFMSCDQILTPGKDCEYEAVIDGDRYEKLLQEALTITSLSIDDDCLTIEVSASGCDGNSWQPELIDSGAIAESEPEQRYLALTLNNEEACRAILTRSFRFNIEDLGKDVGGNRVILNFQNINESILYEF